MSIRARSTRGGPLPREVQVSKKLSWLLRHGAEKEGLVMSNDGYINMAAVLANRNLKSLKVTFEEVQSIVRDNDKQRFSLVPDPSSGAEGSTEQTSIPSATEPGRWMIRANQGHSIKLESDAGLLVPITRANMPREAIHGTTHANWVLISASGGLRPMGRNHVHFASALPTGFHSLATAQEQNDTTSAPVISGMRSSSTVLVYLDVERALEAELPLGLSQNGVILSEGNAEGLIPLQLLKRVEDRTGEGLLLQDGKVIKEAPSAWAKKPTRDKR